MAISTKAEILKEIRNSADYVSGQELCEKLGVSASGEPDDTVLIAQGPDDLQGVGTNGTCRT